MLRDVLTVVLAGGKGTRLDPLTRDRAKPAVPFGGPYRIVDFTLSNCINSGLRRVVVVTQFKSHSLDRHLRAGWDFLPAELGERIEVLPPQQRVGDAWYRGTADAVYQNIYTLERYDPACVLVLSADHIYKMDYGPMVAAHLDRRADVTIGCVPIPVADSDQFGVMEVAADGRVTAFKEKPAATPGLPDDPAHALGSMGIYAFDPRVLFDVLCDDAARADSSHDFGTDVIPRMIAAGGRVWAFRARDENKKGRAYWRDVGTLDALYEANMDLVAVDPELNLYDPGWPVRTAPLQLPPPKFVFADDGPPGVARRGVAVDSLVSPGCIVSGGAVARSVLSPKVRVNSYAAVEDAVLFDGVEVGRHCRVRKAIIDKDVRLPPHTVLGFDPEQDRRRGLTVTAGGVVVVPKGEPPDTFAGG